MNMAVIGAGFVGDQHANAIHNSDRVNLVAVVDYDKERAKKVADTYHTAHYTDAEEMLKAEQPDIVSICLPTFMHEEYVLLAAKYKAHVLCEKPVTLTLESMDRMIAATKEAGVQFMVAQVVRFWPEYVAIKERYDAGEFGDVKMVYGSRLAQHPNWTEWHKNPEMSGGGLFDLHLHDIDFARYIFGEPETVYAVGWQSENKCWNHVSTSIQFKDGVHAVLEGGFDMTENFPFTMTFRMVGESITMDYNMVAGFNLEDVGSSTRSLVYYEDGEEPRRVDVDIEQDPYQTEIDYFAGCIRSGKAIEEVPIEQSREVVRMMLAIQESLETGKIVRF